MNNNNEEEFQTEKDEFLLYSYDEDKKDIKYEMMAKNIKHSPRVSLKLQQQQKKHFTPIRIRNQNPSGRDEQNIQKISSQFLIDFQSGNLQSAEKIAEKQFKLRVRIDSNSKHHCQWFYFGCKNLTGKVKFIINGFNKSDSLYNYGMKVCICKNNIWRREGEKITYEESEEFPGEYCLQFQYEFIFNSLDQKNTITYFAYCYPYTYSDLQKYLTSLKKKQLEFYKVQIIAKSFLKRNVYCLNIGNPQSKDIIFITSRVHPGESVGSYMVQGFIDYLTSDTPEAIMLKEKYLFKIHPMLNPDGVAIGNYRLSYTGHDLNRKWKDTSQKLHPQIAQLKKTVIQMQKKIIMVLDFHGHSRKKNVFFYGCAEKKNSISKEFPFLMSRLFKHFSYSQSSFAIQKSKQGTQRVALYNLLKIPYIYTVQSSFCGDQSFKQQNYTQQTLMKIGANLCEGIAVLFSQQIKKKKIIEQQLVHSMISSKKIILKQFYSNSDYINAGMQTNEGSQSSPSEGCYRQEELINMLDGRIKNNQPLSQSLHKAKRILHPFLFTPFKNIFTSSIQKDDQMNLHRNIVDTPNYKKRIVNKSPSTSQKRRSKFQKLEDELPFNISAQYTINMINGSLFNQSRIEKKTLSIPASKQKLQIIDQKAKREKLRPEFNGNKIHGNQKSGKKILSLVGKANNRGSQYKRVKNYAQQMSIKLRQGSSVQLRKSDSYEQQVRHEEPRVLKINNATFGLLNSTNPIGKNDLRRKFQGILPTGYFNVSIKAKDYIEQKRNMKPPASHCRRLIMKQQDWL